jgi:hypothetical protein
MNGGSHQKKLAVFGKLVVQRHGHGSKRSYNAQEKAVETKTRNQGKREVRQSLFDALERNRE